SAWVKKLAADEEQKAAEPAKPRQRAAAPKEDSSAASRKKDNPYSRPFGRLTVEELERQITDTETAIAECQESFGDADTFKEPARGQQVQAEYQALCNKLEAREAEY